MSKWTFIDVDGSIRDMSGLLFFDNVLNWLCSYLKGEITKEELEEKLKNHAENFKKAYSKLMLFKEENRNADAETLKKVFMDEYLKGEQDDNK